MSCSSIHHIEICLRDVSRTLHLFTYGMGFSVIATRNTPSCKQLVLQHNNTTLVLTHRKNNNVCNDIYDNNTEKESGLNSSGLCCNSSGRCSNSHLNNSEVPTNTDNCAETKHLKETDSSKALRSHEFPEEDWTVFCCGNSTTHTVDSVFNAALVVNDVHVTTKKAQDKGGIVLKKPTVISDAQGEITYSIIATGVGNIVHTLIDRRKYNGTFLPGFTLIESNDDNKCVTDGQCTDGKGSHSSSCKKGNDGKIGNYSTDNEHSNDMRPASDLDDIPVSTHMDHVALICEEGRSKEIIEWYEQVFNMKRFLINSNEDLNEGLKIEDNVGLRLKALEYWKCFETGLHNPGDTSDCSLKVVIGEPITSIKGNHVTMFLDNHGGAGIQHIALHSPSMLQTVQSMARRGVPFRKAPPTYYNQGGKLNEMITVGLAEQASALQEAGVLLDMEADPQGESFDDQQLEDPAAIKNRYLMQIFTEPIFERPTFFMEVVQRCGAAGFGVGNITALARSIAMHYNKPLALEPSDDTDDKTQKHDTEQQQQQCDEKYSTVY
uniref:4-hydroxyphenylpyruvate dioxygenase-like protein n=1 Tax=Hirondellea gigas TaxID=1518452 RepID=A0A6A7G3T8_9CRUS